MATSEPVEDEATAFWEALYGDEPKWSGRVNPVFADLVGDLVPGTALDLGCGEGGDAIWLAERSWTVTAADISPTALGRGEALAAERGVSERITWARHDFDVSFPDGTFDLVSAQFLHSPVPFGRQAVLRRATEAVAPGGSLVVVGHAAPPPWAAAATAGTDGHDGAHQHGHGHHHEAMPQADEVLADLHLGADWSVERCEQVEREARGPDGQTGNLLDSVVVVRRTV